MCRDCGDLGFASSRDWVGPRPDDAAPTQRSLNDPIVRQAWLIGESDRRRGHHGMAAPGAMRVQRRVDEAIAVYAANVRRAALLLVLTLDVALVAQQLLRAGSHPAPAVSESVQQRQAERALTLLDFWAQTVVPGINLEQSRARALQVGDVATAVRLKRRIRQRLLQAERFPLAAAHDPLLGNRDAASVRALRAAAAAWADWATAVLRHGASRASDQAHNLAALETKGVDLQQAAYAAVDTSLRAAVTAR